MKKSAGILVYRKKNNKIEILLVHPGGPYWQNKDENSWSIPKGEVAQTTADGTQKNADITQTYEMQVNEFTSSPRESASSLRESAVLLETALREFEEETGLKLSNEDKKKIHYFDEVKSSNKIIYVFILEKDFGDNLKPQSNWIEIEWPPKSKNIIKIPEVDKAGYFDLETAETKLVSYQKKVIDKLQKYLKK